MRIRREKRSQLAAQGMEPYAIGLPITTTIADVRAAHPDLEPDVATGRSAALAGRVIFLRNTGKLCFATLRAGDGTRALSRMRRHGAQLADSDQVLV